MKKPTLKEVVDYCNNPEQAQLFYLYFESVDWMIGKQGNKSPMKNWKSAITGWCKRSKPRQNRQEIAANNPGNRLTDRIWERMSEVYGSKWISGFGALPTKSWINVIENLKPENIGFGLREMLKHHKEWPPTLSQFDDLCKMQVEIKALPSIDYKEQRALTKSAREKALAEIRNIVR